MYSLVNNSWRKFQKKLLHNMQTNFFSEVRPFSPHIQADVCCLISDYTDPHSLLSPDTSLRRRISQEGLPLARQNPFLKTTSFCQTGVIFDDAVDPENFGTPKIYGIQKKRYNNEIFSAGLGPV